MTSSRFEINVRMPLAHFVLDVAVSSPARTLGVFGPSGAGKTSLIETLAGWRRPESGRIRLNDTLLFDGSSGVSLPIEERRAGYVPQDALLLPHWNVERNVRAGELRHGEASADSLPSPHASPHWSHRRPGPAAHPHRAGHPRRGARGRLRRAARSV